MTDLEDPEQWQRERDYFDHAAENVEPYDLPLIAARYEKAMASPLYPLEVAYAFMGKLEGKRVLDVGCGNGENSVLFAHWGAQVTGVDSPQGPRNCPTTRSGRRGERADQVPRNAVRASCRARV
jgi:2-polyprenyl-3-methyl-5-hydroxy-6-metoxy-1,4-benzoquinol methylase